MLINQRNVLPTLLVLYLLFNYDGVQGEIKLSEQEELALEKQLKLLNKPAVKTIKTKWGDTYDCVDFYKQPAFDHPLLKNHNFHPKMKPTLPTIKHISKNSTVDIFSKISLEKNNCPSGTVPIKKITRDDLIRQRNMPSPEDFAYEPQSETNKVVEPTGGYNYKRAIVHTPKNHKNKFGGAGMAASLWSHYVFDKQQSVCRLKIQKGQDSMQVGWRAGNTHCFNTLCPGFLLVNNNILLDNAFANVSRRGNHEQQPEIVVYIVRDLANEHWWLLLGEKQVVVGFWPNWIFTALANDFATNVEWGGVTYTPPEDFEHYAPMGSGMIPVRIAPAHDAYCRALMVLNDKGETLNAMQINQGIIQQTLVLYFLLSYNYVVQGEIKLSEVEDQELESQLKFLNKPAIKTIKMKPTLSRIKQTLGTSKSKEASTIWLNDGGCPFGSVPIKRITKDDLIRQKHLPPPEDLAFHTQFFETRNHSGLKKRFLSTQGYRVAIVSTRTDLDYKFGGAGMSATLWNPYVKGQQHSGCRLKVQKLSDIIQIGWRVDPTLYGDTLTRMFIHFQAGNIGCFNTLCPGFVLIDTEIGVGAPFSNVSHRGDIHNLWEYPMYLDRDLVNGNWWVLVQETHREVGFWPQNIFTQLAGFATHIEWGGVAYSPPDIPEPPMGSSFFPTNMKGYDGSCNGITALNYKGETIEVNTIPHTDNPDFYRVYDIPPRGTNRKYKHTVLYGGPGERT
ncbi:hypothetical protein KY285_018352 [Solanum tuberosum]|nr:hypothetical protein KY289_018513 [Solanum tuberosum]KAH0704074.1 hypothetical protein KY285_018352 [Solanum tuberosum]